MVRVVGPAPAQGVRRLTTPRPDVANALVARELVLLVDVRPAVIVAHVRRALAPPASPAAQIVAAPELAVPQLGVHDRAAVRLPVRPVADLAPPGLEVDAVAGAAMVVAGVIAVDASRAEDRRARKSGIGLSRGLATERRRGVHED